MKSCSLFKYEASAVATVIDNYQRLKKWWWVVFCAGVEPVTGDRGGGWLLAERMVMGGEAGKEVDNYVCHLSNK